MKNLLYIVLFGSTPFLHAQQADVESLKKLGRDSLIKLAIVKLDDPKFNPKYYDRVEVKANKTSLIVSFMISVEFHTKRSCFYDWVYVTLTDGTSGKGVQGDCEEPEYYHPSRSDRRKIDFVFDAINKDNEIGDIPDKKLSPGTTMEISEHLDYYYVEVDSWSTASDYKVNKITGKIYDAGHKHYARDHEREDEYEIIK
jgi:hypothetical protein